MAGRAKVPKQVLIEQIRRTVIDGKSGVFTILTDKKRSIMLRFSEGKLIHSHCRSRKVEDAISALNECDELTFNHSASQPKDQPELIAAEALLSAIVPDEVVENAAAVNHELLERIDPLVEVPSSDLEVKQEEKAEPEPAPQKEDIEHRLFF